MVLMQTIIMQRERLRYHSSKPFVACIHKNRKIGENDPVAMEENEK